MAPRSLEEPKTVTWNPVTGCDRVSAGCDHCYALALAKRLKAMGVEKYQADGDPATSGPGFGLTMHPKMLQQPYHWRSPRIVFVNSVVKGVDVVSEPVASLVDLGSLDLDSGRNAGIRRERRDEPGLFVLDLQVRQQHLAQKLRPLAEHLRSVLGLPVRIASEVRVVVILDRPGAQALREPPDKSPVCHGDRDDWVDATVPVRAHSGDEYAALAVHDPGYVGPLFQGQSADSIRRSSRIPLPFQAPVAVPVVPLFG